MQDSFELIPYARKRMLQEFVQEESMERVARKIARMQDLIEIELKQRKGAYKKAVAELEREIDYIRYYASL